MVSSVKQYKMSEFPDRVSQNMNFKNKETKNNNPVVDSEPIYLQQYRRFS